MSIIERNWLSARCPIVNGIFYPDDTVALVDIDAPTRAEGVYRIAVRGRIPLKDVGASEASLSWTSLGQLARATDSERDVTAVVGEGGMGADGFVAALAASSGRLLWLAFFDCSNPFQAVAATRDGIAARTNLEVEWTFPVRRPEQVTTRFIGRERT